MAQRMTFQKMIFNTTLSPFLKASSALAAFIFFASAQKEAQRETRLRDRRNCFLRLLAFFIVHLTFCWFEVYG